MLKQILQYEKVLDISVFLQFPSIPFYNVCNKE